MLQPYIITQTEAMESWRPEIEDGLTLFQHMRAREHKDYLNNCNDDIEEIKYEGGLSTFRISGSTPTRKGGGLLISDMEKSDYDWLLTPPGTPLFPSLDQETASVDFSQRTTSTYSAPASKSLKDPSLKSSSESPIPYQQISAASFTHKATSKYASPSPQSTYSISPVRPSKSSSRARSPSASPAPSLTRSRPATGAFSPSRSTTPTGRSPVTASKSTSRPSTPTLCRNNTSPSSASRRGHLAHRGPRRSLSSSLGPWDPIMGDLPTEPLPNLRTSPSSKSLQRGKSGCSGQGLNKDFDTCHDAQYAIELLTQRKRNKGPSNIYETSRVSTRCQDSKYGSSPARRQPQSTTTTCTKEMISSFANGKLTERQTPPRRNSQNMFRPLMLSAPSTSIYSTGSDFSKHDISGSAVVQSMSINESPRQNMRLSHERGCSHDSDSQDRDCQINQSIAIDGRKLEGSVNNQNDLSHEARDHILLEEAIKEPMKSKAKPEEDTCRVGAWDRNQPVLCEDLKDNSACKDIQIAGAQELTCAKSLNSDRDVSAKDLDPLKKHHKHVLLAHSFSGESQMQDVRFSREKLYEHSGEENKMSAFNKFQSSLRSKLNKDDVEPAFENFSTQAVKNCACVCSQDGVGPTNFHPVRRQLSMKGADLVYHTWNLKKAGSFDISLSDSYSCSESLDSSYVDNHTEKFSEDLSEVDSMSHTGYSISACSITNYSFYNHTCAEKPFAVVPTVLGIGDERFMHSTSLNSMSGALEASEPAVKCCMKGQSIQSQTQSQASTILDLSQLQTASADSLNQAIPNGNSDALNAKDVLGLMDACNTTLVETKQLTAGKLQPKVGVKGEHATKALKLVAEDGDGGEIQGLKSTSTGPVMEETLGWDADSKKVQPWASPWKHSITLEEATDTILFCSSIVHKIVYEAATLGEEKLNARIEEPSRVCGRIPGPSPLWRTSESWSPRRDPTCNNAQLPADHGYQSMTKHVLTSNKGLLTSTHIAGKTPHKRKKKTLCGFGFCRVM